MQMTELDGHAVLEHHVPDSRSSSSPSSEPAIGPRKYPYPRLGTQNTAPTTTIIFLPIPPLALTRPHAETKTKDTSPRQNPHAHKYTRHTHHTTRRSHLISPLHPPICLARSRRLSQSPPSRGPTGHSLARALPGHLPRENLLTYFGTQFRAWRIVMMREDDRPRYDRDYD